MTMTDDDRADFDTRVRNVETRITRLETLLYVIIAMLVPQFATTAHPNSMDGK